MDPASPIFPCVRKALNPSLRYLFLEDGSDRESRVPESHTPLTMSHADGPPPHLSDTLSELRETL